MLARVQKFGAVRALLSGLVGCIGVPFALALAVRSFAFQPFDAPSASMAPTLQRGDYFFVSKFTYGYGRYSLPFAPAWFAARIFAAQPKRGDVIIFVHPKDRTDWVKRIVGLPGDTVQMKDGRLFINGEMVERRRIEPGFKTQGPFGDPIVAPTYDETLPGGGTHRIIEIDDDHGVLDNTDVFRTPPNAYFVLGDNRENSMDSRVGTEKGGVGFVPFENIVGRAAMLYYSIDPDSPVGPAAPRLGRIGLAVE
jgi:signal peptidase I